MPEGIFDEYLLTAVALNDRAAEAHSASLERFNGGCEVVNLYLDAVPAAGCRRLAVSHCLARSAGAWLIQEQAQVAAGEACEAGRWVHVDLEAEVLRVERQRRVHVIDDVAD